MMDRLTEKRKDKSVIPLRMASCGIDLPYWRIDKDSDLVRYLSGDAADRLAAYEDTGLTPEEVKAAKTIAERIATADYPHNFQRERRDIVDYMNWITDVMREAKAWWNGRIKDKGETWRMNALQGKHDDGPERI